MSGMLPVWNALREKPSRYDTLAVGDGRILLALSGVHRRLQVRKSYSGMRAIFTPSSRAKKN
jgi:hypothetical protein